MSFVAVRVSVLLNIVSDEWDTCYIFFWQLDINNSATVGLPQIKVFPFALFM